MIDSVRNIEIAEYDYPLPDERIAKYPLAERDSSKLLVYNKGNVSEDVFRNLPEYIPAGSLMIFNNSKVPASSAIIYNDGIEQGIYYNYAQSQK